MTVPAYVRPLFLLLALIVAPTVYVACARMPSAEEVQQDELARAQADYDSLIRDIVKELKSPDPKVRTGAAIDLTGMIPRRYYDGRQSVRDTRAELALDVLITLLDDPIMEVRQAAASAIATMRTEGAMAVLEKFFPEEQVADIRYSILARLTTWNTHPGALPLILMGLDDPSPEVRCRAGLELASFGGRLGPGAFDSLDHGKMVKKLLARIEAAGKGERHCYLSALSDFPDQRSITVPVLIRSLDSPDHREVDYAVLALGFLKAEEAVPSLIKTLKRVPPADPDEIALALGRIGDHRAVEPLLEIAKEGWLMNTLWALGNLRDPRAYPFLSEFLEEALDREQQEYHAIVVDAAHALGRLGDRRAVPLLLRAMKSPDVRLQVNAARGLAELGAVEAIPLVEKLSRKKVWTVYTRDATGWKQPRTPFRKLMDEILEKLYAAQRARKEAA